MSVFQKVANWLRGLTTPKWLTDIYEYLLEEIIFPALKQLKEQALLDIQQLILEAAKMDTSGPEKFKFVKDAFVKKWSKKIQWDTTTLNWLINLIYAEMKKKGYVS